MYRTLVEETLEAWQYTRPGVLDEVESIPESEFGFRPPPESRSAEERVRRLIESGLVAAGESALTRRIYGSE